MHLCSLRHLWIAVFVVAASGQVPPEPPPAGQAIADLPWPAKLGVRSHFVTAAVPLIDRVVLVPDAATYVDELSKWSPRGRWPVLIEDDVLTPMFVRRFSPAQLIRRETVGADSFPDEPEQRRRALDAIIIGAVGGDPAAHTVREAFAAQGYAPPGIVIASFDDPAWTAAIALAAGRAQPLAWMSEADGSFGTPNDELDDDGTARLLAAVDRIVAEQKWPWQSLGDDIDAITICRSMAVKSRAALPPAMRVEVGGPSAPGPVAITDLLGRNSDGTRYAIVGWIFGSESRAAYMAMCSLFLPREQVTMFDTYPAGQPWDRYATAPAAAAMIRAGFTTQETHGNQPGAADERGWLRTLVGGWSCDVAVVNTKGNCDFFDLASGSASPLDVPLLNEPAALHLIHSWSLQFPARLDTVGARWLDRGAYAAVGSCHEPYLAAFIPPSELAHRWTNFVPFLVAARWWDGQGPLSKPWRVVTIGDPLMLCAPPARVSIRRTPSPAEYGVDLGEHVKSLMRDAANDPTGELYRQAIEILSMFGRDDIAAGVWRLAAGHGDAGGAVATAASRAALDPLFRLREVDEFLRAWSHLPVRDERASTMLWHLLTPRLAGGNIVDRDTVIQLQSTIRQPFPQFDLRRLAPALMRIRDQAHVREVINREMEKTNSAEARRALAELMDQY